ncbi:MAG: ShlB/FhaC/HecB family hemolysin secretion/activation protein [Pseudomonadota bacterium]
MCYDKKNIWARVGVAALAASFTASFSLLALAQQRPDAGTIIEQQRERVRIPAAEPQVLPEAQPARPAMSASPTLRVTVTAFRVSGNTAIAEAELLAAVQEFVGKDLDFEGLNEAASRIQRLYRKRGYFLAVSYLPQQEIQNGVVEIVVLEGTIGNVVLEIPEHARLRESLPRGILDAYLKPGSLITETGLERPLLLINDLAGVSVTSTLGPSERAVGAADLKVKLAEEPRVNGYVDADNGGNRFTGEFRVGVNLNATNLAGYGDLLSFRTFISDENMKFGRVAYVVPVGYYGTRVGLSYTAFDYKLAKDFAALEAHGKGEVATLYALHPFVRTRNANFLVQGAFETKNLKDYIDSTQSIEERKIESGKLGAIGDFRDGLLSGGLNSYSLTYTAGKLALSPTGVLLADQTAGTGLFTDGRFSKTNGDYRRLQRISKDWNLLVSFSGQVASKNLASAEKFSLGGPNGVRAYPVGEGTGDSGYLFSAELRYLVPKFKVLRGDVTLSAFYDQGDVKSNEEPLLTNAANMRGLAGYGLGLALGREGSFLVKTSVAFRAETERAQSDGAGRDPRIWLQAIKWF